jgi:DNA mismatch repair protein MutS
MEDQLTPMMRQYREAKAQIPPDAILLFRLGDFYEMFFEDAVRASSIMELTLTKRNGYAMCGFPYHALAAQLPRLLAANVKVAIAEQLEDPKFAAGLVKRAVTRIITPGTVTESSALRPEENNFLTALVIRRDEKIRALASLDISTGEFKVAEFDSAEKLLTEFARLDAKECLIPAGRLDAWKKSGGAPDPRNPVMWTELDADAFAGDPAGDFLKHHFGVATLDGFGCKDHPECVAAAGAVLHYAVENLRRDAAHVTKLEFYRPGENLELDAASQRNLELVEPLHGGGRQGTLLGVLDLTVTSMGGRLMRDWILRPLYAHDAIVARLDAVEQLKDDPLTLAEIRETVGTIRDLERIVGRINIGSANPRDLQALAAGLRALPDVRLLLQNLNAPLLEALHAEIGEFPAAVARIEQAIADDPPVVLQDGGIIRDGYSETLDELRRAATEGRNWLADIQRREQERTGIKSLKVKFNQVFGYYIEVSKANLALIPEDYLRKQTLVNAERFITPELKELESKILGAEEKSKALEYQLFTEVRDFLLPFTAPIQRSAAALARLDALAALAEAARRNRYIRPKITSGDLLSIRGGRHPVLDARPGGEPFVPNDVLLDCEANRMMIITGPNMAGKSTYIRQTALLVIMAQMGSFIPADAAEIGLVDRIFTRVGAADDLSRGQSTFMVEMIETANILNCATNRSLVILDEIGRGTSTFDGLSIAWAVAEFLHDDPASRCRTMFATHYHELTELAASRRGVKNYNVAVREYGDKIIFLRQIVPGSTDRSYGIHVAKLAGLPNPVIDRANAILEMLEKSSGTPRDAMQSLPRQAVRAKRRRKGDDADEDEETLFQPHLF